MTGRVERGAGTNRPTDVRNTGGHAESSSPATTTCPGPLPPDRQHAGGRHSQPPETFETPRENEMPGKKKPGPSVKKPKTYEALRDKGMSKQRAAKISNAQANKENS